MIFQLCKWHFDTFINWHTVNLKKKVGRRFPHLRKCNPFQSSPVLSIHVPSWLCCVLFELFNSFELLFWYFSKFSDYFIDQWKLPKTAWASPLNSTKVLTSSAKNVFVSPLCSTSIFGLPPSFFTWKWKWKWDKTKSATSTLFFKAWSRAKTRVHLGLLFNVDEYSP